MTIWLALMYSIWNEKQVAIQTKIINSLLWKLYKEVFKKMSWFNIGHLWFIYLFNLYT